MRNCKIITLILFCLFLEGCVHEVQKVDVMLSVNVPPIEELGTLRIDRMLSDIEEGTIVGEFDNLLNCYYHPLAGDVIWGDDEAEFDKSEFHKTVFKALDRGGLNMLGDPDDMFEGHRLKDKKSHYYISGQLKEVDVGFCADFSFFFGVTTGKISGRAKVKTAWQVYSTLDEEVVYSKETEGYYELKAPMPKGHKKIIRKAMYNATKNLLADEKFIEAIKKPSLKIAKIDAKKSTKSTKFKKAIVIPRKKLFKDTVTANIKNIKHSVVLIDMGSTHGSGFFISPEYIITNRHVVSANDDVTVVLQGGIRIPGKVLRRDHKRDVVLIKVAKVSGASVPIRMKNLIETEEVYAIGSPLRKKFQGTVTKGIVSNFGQNGFRLPLIQADVDVQGGNSGGALVDKNGNLVGISVSGMGETSIGLNFFIPIKDALNHLNVSIR
ncbi:MAG: trypsin-like peptidase domain-containing protein [Alphaproteobacteria bacterium]|nr:trypsin-like peptidase domain-containing protein [Alphaproteobacteria bacterium]